MGPAVVVPFVPFSAPRPTSIGVGPGVMAAAAACGLIRGAPATTWTAAAKMTMGNLRCMVVYKYCDEIASR